MLREESANKYEALLQFLFKTTKVRTGLLGALLTSGFWDLSLESSHIKLAEARMDDISRTSASFIFEV